MLITYRKILVALDGSEFAAQAIPHAYSLAKHLGAELVLFRVVRDAGKTAGPQDNAIPNEEKLESAAPDDEESTDAALAALHRHIAQIDDSAVNITPVVEVGLPQDMVCRYARDNSVDLIVMTSHGRTGLRRFVHGSVAESVLRQTPCPTLVLRSA